MNFNKISKIISVFFFLCLSILMINSCDLLSPKKVNHPETAEYVVPHFEESKKHFFHAWLAYCISGELDHGKEKAQKALTALAKSRLNYGLTNDTLSSVFGSEELVWGPAVSVDDEGDNAYTSKNLTFCSKSIDSAGIVNYAIGIAGTNMTDPYDWFVEDLKVRTDSMVVWKTGGKISYGSEVGFKIVNDLRGLNTNTNTNTTVVEFLKTELAKNPTATVSVSGHSLGGALTQVFSSHLQSDFPNHKVSAWAYAGPTAGNSTFANKLYTQLNGRYHGYNNAHDLVPHMWEDSTLLELCDLYNNIPLCGYTIQANYPINGIIQYYRNMIKGADYKIPGTPNKFSVAPLSPTPDECDTLKSNMADGYSYTEISDIIFEIGNQCHPNSFTGKEFYYQFANYMAEMGYQHTRAYYLHFFRANLNDNNFINAITNAVPSKHGYIETKENEDEARIILENFLTGAKDYLVKNKITPCGCK